MNQRGFIALVVGAFVLGFTGILYRGSEMPPAAANFWRLLFALPPLYLWMFFENETKPTLHNHKYILLTGLLFALDVVFYYSAMNFTTIGKATLLSAMATLFVVVFSLFLGEKLNLKISFALFLACLGTYFILSSKGVGQAGYSGELKGDILAAISALFFALYIIVTRVARNNVGAGAFNFYNALYCAVFCLGFSMLLQEDLWPKTLASWLHLIALGVLTQALGQGLTAYGLGKVPAGIASITMTLNAPIAALASAYLLNEQPLPMQIFGGVLVLGALIIIRPK